MSITRDVFLFFYICTMCEEWNIVNGYGMNGCFSGINGFCPSKITTCPKRIE